MVLKLKRFSHLLDRSFGLGSRIGLRYLSNKNIVEPVTMDVSPLKIFAFSYGTKGEW